MKTSLVDKLCCPECRGDLRLRASEADAGGTEVMEGQLECHRGHAFPIRGGIPRFVASDAYVESFSFEWLTHSTTQLDTVRATWSTEAFGQFTGWSAPDLQGRLVLDVGCGMGRYADVAERMGAEVVGVDLSFAVDAAFRNIGLKPRVHIVQADIFRLPFKEAQFDAIYSLGVLHHTVKTRDAFLQLPRLLKPGGVIAVWVYARYFGQRLHDAIRIGVTSKLPRGLLHRICFVLAQAPIYWLYRVPVLCQLLQLIFWYPADHTFYQQMRWRWLDLFDFYSPTYAHRHTYPEVWGWFREAGLTSIELQPTPVSMRGKRS
jgi:SAM-dependent methyltransferase